MSTSTNVLKESLIPLITAATNTGLSIKQVGIAAAPLSAADAIDSTARKVAVKDTLANIKTKLADLLTNVNKISSIEVTDAGALSFTAEQLKTYGTVIAKISGNRELNATGAAMADLSGLLKNKNVKAIAVADTAANIQAGMGTLIGNNARLTSITKTVAATDMTLSSASFKLANAAGGVLSKFADAFANGKIKLTGAAAADVAALTAADQTKVKTVAIADSLSNIFNNASAITTAGAKVDTISTTAAKAPIKSMSKADYDTFKNANATLITMISTGNATAMNNAFALTGVLISDITGGIGADAQVKSVTVSDTAAHVVAASSADLAKVTKADMTTAAADMDAIMLTKLAALGSKLSSVKLTNADKLTGVDVAVIKDKAKATVLAKTSGQYGDPVGLEIVNAKLADVNGLLANKQVNKADISDTAKNMLAFSADKFTLLANSKNVSFAITDSAANISKYHTLLASAVKQFNTDRVTLSVKDTAANLEANLAALDEVATAITGADEAGQSKYDASRIKIQQSVSTGGAAETSTLIKVNYTNYSERRDVLQYIKDATAGMLQEHVALDTSAPSSLVGDAASVWSVQRAKDISNTLQLQKYMSDPLLVSATPPSPPDPTSNKVTLTTGGDVTGGFGLRAADNTIKLDATTFGFSSDDRKTWVSGAVGKSANQLYQDVAKIDVTLKGASAAADFVLVKADKDLKTGAGNFLKTGLTVGFSMFA